MAMDYNQTIEYLFNSLPMFQRDGKSAFKKDLKNTIALCSHLGNPQKSFKSIHIAGTNGKGSTAHMLASIFQEAGYKTALYTSPHLIDFRERIKINGEMISEGAVMDFVAKNRQTFEAIRPSFFEWTVALAFHHFANEKVEIAIVETGMGGRLDSTNVIEPELSIITNISLDHTQYLGDTKEKIAGEKAGIIKGGIPVLIGERSGVAKVFSDIAEAKNSNIFYAEDSETPSNLSCALQGSYQKKNLRTVYSAYLLLKDQWKLSFENVSKGCRNVLVNTGLRGRWDVLIKKPLVIADTAHNEDGIKETMSQVKNIVHDKLHIVLGMVSDKEHSKILSLLPKNAIYYFCAAKIARALPAADLKKLAEEHGLHGLAYISVIEAAHRAISEAGKEDLVYIGGSTFTVAEILGEKWDVLDSNQ